MTRFDHLELRGSPPRRVAARAFLARDWRERVADLSRRRRVGVAFPARACRGGVALVSRWCRAGDANPARRGRHAGACREKPCQRLNVLNIRVVAAAGIYA